MAQTEKGIIYPYDYNEVADVPSDFKALAESIDALLNDYSLNTDSGNKIVLEMNNTTYKIKAVLKDKDDNVISTSNEIDLPLENMVTNVAYNNQKLILTHQDGHTTEISIADLISDLASKEEVTELQSQVDDLTTLVETELDTNTVEGTEIDVSDSAEYRGPVMPGANLEQEQLSGNQLFDVTDTYNVSSEITVDEEGWITATYDNTAGSSAKNLLYYTNKSDLLETNKSYAIFTEIKSVNGTGVLYAISIYSNQSQSSASLAYNFNGLSNNSIKKSIFNTISDFNTATTMLRTLIQIRPGESGSITFRLSVLENTDTAIEQFLYEKYCGGQAAPNPSYEIPIKVVTGDNVVKHVGKNLFDKDNKETSTGIIYHNGFTLIKSSDRVARFVLPHILKAGTYTISFDNVECNATETNFFNLSLQYGNTNTNVLQNVVINRNTSISFTAPSEFNKLYFFIGSSSSISDSTKITVDNVQLEEGTTPTQYEPYRGEEYKLDLWKENEFDSENAEKLNAYFSDNEKIIASSNSAKTVVVSCKSNTTYRISKKQSTRFRVGYSSSKLDYSGILDYAKMCDSEKEVIIQTNSTAKYMYIYYYSSSSDTLTEQEILDSIQIQESIELCKIGDYGDILFKIEVGDENYNAELEEEAWYKKQLIGKFNDAQQLTSAAVNENYFEMYTPTLNVEAGLNSSVLRNIAISNVVQSYPTNYSGLNGSTSSAKIRVRLSIDYATSHTEMKDYLIAKNFCIYYVQNSPTYEKITNPTLISQLESLRKAKWFKGVNHFWTETENLEPNLKGTYKQSNNIKNKERDERLDNLESRLALLE